MIRHFLAVNIKFFKRLANFFPFFADLQAGSSGISNTIRHSKVQNILWWAFSAALAMVMILTVYEVRAYPAGIIHEPVQACVLARDIDLTNAIRSQFAQCLGWVADSNSPVCLGSYQPQVVTPLSTSDEIHIQADEGSFYQNKPSLLKGNVEVQQAERVVNAQTAYIYRDSSTNQVTKIEFLGEVHYLEPGMVMIADKAIIHPQDKSGETTDVLYRLDTNRHGAMLPAWGRAALIKRFANKNFLFRNATYTTCAPQDKAWDIEAKTITIDDASATGVARNARLRIREVPVLYLPYLSFPTNNERKSGFLLPQIGYSNVGGFDLGLPYYWNIAPNYDATLIPHAYTERGVMLGGEFRYLTSKSYGALSGNVLPSDRAYRNFLHENEAEFPQLQGNSTNRWDVGFLHSMSLSPNLTFNVNALQVSDDYYLQDFSTNLATITQRQLLRQADITYTSENWVLRAMGQSYQTLHPVNETPISSVYERLPQLMANGFYYDLPFNSTLNILGQYDQFRSPIDRWDVFNTYKPQGPRAHLNPIVSMPIIKPWGYITPSAQLVETYYEVEKYYGQRNVSYNRSLPRYSVDSGLYFDREVHSPGGGYVQTLEPRLFYLNVPYRNQTAIPVYDSGYMIFNMDQLFRTNRFSGFDRIGDTNQLSYALTSRWLSDQTGAERALLSVGQSRYFAQRHVELCQSPTGYCVQDPYSFGYLSSTSETSPIASRGVFQLNSSLGVTADYVWDPATRATNNGDMIFHYQPDTNKIVSAGYSYLVNGDVTQIRGNGAQDNALHQAIVAFSWPVSDRWSSVGAYSQNISKNYSMMSLFGLQYDSCCWAMRVLGGRTFKSLNSAFEPQYNNNVYVQFLLKGLGSVANSDPYNILTTYIPGYNDSFHR